MFSSFSIKYSFSGNSLTILYFCIFAIFFVLFIIFPTLHVSSVFLFRVTHSFFDFFSDILLRIGLIIAILLTPLKVYLDFNVLRFLSSSSIFSRSLNQKLFLPFVLCSLIFLSWYHVSISVPLELSSCSKYKTSNFHSPCIIFLFKSFPSISCKLLVIKI